MKRNPVIFVFAVVLILAMSVPAHAQEMSATEAQHLAVAQQLIDETVIAGNEQDPAEIFSTFVTVHSPTADVSRDFPGPVWMEILAGRIGSDEMVTLDHIAAADDIVFAHLSSTVTFENPVMTPGQTLVQPTNEPLVIRRVLVMRFEAGKIVEIWDYFMNPIWAVDYAAYLPDLTTD